MLNLLILIIVICVIVAILKSVLSALGEIILGIIGIAIIIAAIVFLGPIILRLLSHLPKFLPWILIILAGLFVLGCIITLAEKLRYRAQLERLDQLGIDKIGSAPETWKKKSELGLVETTSSGYVISISFYKKVINHIGRTSTLTMCEFEQHCVTCASQFQVSFAPPLLEFLQKKELLFQFSLSNGETCLLSKSIMERCEDLFLKEGAATEDEFVQICERTGLLDEFPQDGRRFVAFFFAHMLSCGKVQKVELNDLGDCLYVAKTQRQNSNMVRREISID